MATKKKKLVTIKNMNDYGNALAKALRMSFGFSKQLKGKAGLVKQKKVKEHGNVTSIEITVGEGMKDKSGNPATDMIRSMEYGATPHRIKPKRARYLAFHWPTANVQALYGSISLASKKNRSLIAKGSKKFVGRSASTGKLLFNYVDHPGMEGKYFMTKALSETYGRATKKLQNDIRYNLIDILNFEVQKINAKR